MAEFVIPCARRLLKTINGYVQATNKRNRVGGSKARRLFHINHFMKVTIKKNIADVQLAKGPTTRQGKSENNLDSGRLHNRAEHLKVV